MKRMVDPPKPVWLLHAFLRARFEALNMKGKGASYEKIGREYGIAKQQVLTLIHGGTLGAVKFFDVMQLRWSGNYDTMLAEARAWWDTLDRVQKYDVARWAEESEHNRKSAKRGPKSSDDGDGAQANRLQKGLRVPELPPAPTSRAKKKKKE